MKLIDISYPYDETMAIYPNNPEFACKKVQELEKGDTATVSHLSMGSHTGTHIDAPSHAIVGGRTIDQIPLEEMNGIARVLDLRGNTEITKRVLCSYDIRAGEIVLLKTDNSQAFQGKCVLTEYVTLDYEAAQYLVDKKVKMVCIDYMTIERPRSKRIPQKSIHTILLSQDILIAEALNLTELQEGIYQLYCFPLNVSKADGAPARIAVSSTLLRDEKNLS